MKNLRNIINSHLGKKLIDKILDPKIFFLLVAFLLIQLWFSKGMLFGGTEVGIPTYAPGKILDQIKWMWWEALGPGASFPTVSASMSLYALMAILERFGFSAILIQKILFFLILYLQGLGGSLVFRAIISKNNRLQILAGLLYVFNPYMMTYVWHRFIYANFVLSAVLPLLIYFYLQLLEKKEIKFIFFFLVTSLFSSYMFSAVAPVIAIWFSIFVLYVAAVIANRKSFKMISRITFFTILLFVFWILTNLWWVYPLISSKTIFNVFSIRGEVDTLLALRGQTTINYVIRGTSSYFLFLKEDWGSIYNSLLFRFLSWIPVLFILFGLIGRIRHKKIWYMILLFLAGIFVAKGAAEPLGNFTTWLYTRIFFLGAIRNPFEKLGLLVILPASVIATIGINNCWNLYKTVYLKIIIVALIIGCGIYVWPMWSDKLFGSKDYPLYFTLPEDYPVISDFLSKELNTDYGKILYLPISEEDSATYNWKYPYNGVELASQLFPGSSISRFLYISSVDQVLKESARVFHTRDYNFQRQLISNFGIKYIVLNKNLDWYSRSVDDPQFVERTLDFSPDLKMIKETENLKVYKFIPKTLPAIFSADSIMLVTGVPMSELDNDYIWRNLGENGVILQPDRYQNVPKEIVKKEIIFPTRVLINWQDPEAITDLTISRPYVKHLPDTLYYPLILLKEKIELELAPSYERPMKMLSLSQKRLIESQKLQEQNKKIAFSKSIERYLAYLDQTADQLRKLPIEAFDVQSKITLRIILDEEKKLLENLIKIDNGKEAEGLIERGINAITNLRKESGLEAYYIYQDIGQFNGSAVTYQFAVQKETKSKLMLTLSNPLSFSIDTSKKIKVLLDGQIQDILLTKEDSPDIYSLGDMELKAGIHEISLFIPENKEAVRTANFIKKSGIIESGENSSVIKLNTSNEKSWVEYLIPDYNPDKIYSLKFYYRVIKGASPQIQFWQDSDKLRVSDEPKIIRNLEDNFYDFDWKYISLSLGSNNNASVHLNRNTREPVIRIFTPYWNNCETKNSRNAKLCKNPKFKEMYNKPSIVEVRDLEISEVFTGSMFLDYTTGNNFSPSVVSFKKLSPVEYSVETSSTNLYQYLILNEGFHTDWKIIPDPKSDAVLEKDHFLTNGYANGWLFGKTGKISFKIKFIAQDYLYQGMVISVISLIIFIVIMNRRIFSRKNKSNYNE